MACRFRDCSPRIDCKQMQCIAVAPDTARPLVVFFLRRFETRFADSDAVNRCAMP
jgi:hypothetical protein